MQKIFDNYQDYNSPTLNYLFGSVFYMRAGTMVVEVKINSVHYQMKRNRDGIITREYLIEYATPLVKGEYRGSLLTDLPIYKTPGLNVDGGCRAFSEHSVKCAMIEVSKALGIVNRNTYFESTLSDLGSSFPYYKVSFGKVEKTHAVLIGIHFHRCGSVVANFAENVSLKACSGRWDGFDLAMFKENRTYFFNKRNPVPHLLMTKEDAERKLLSSGQVVRFGDVAETEKEKETKTNPLDTLTEGIEAYAKLFGFKAEIKFTPLEK